MPEVYKSKNVRISEDRVSVKIRDEKGKIIDRVIIPTDYYPLPGNNMQIFTKNNTEVITDRALLDLIDAVEYKRAGCYENTRNLLDVLNEKGCDVKSYAGWSFVSECNYPVHHCFVVVDDKHIIDLADDIEALYEYMQEVKVKSKEDFIEKSIEYQKNNAKNTDRIKYVGRCSEVFLHIVSEQSPEEAKALYTELIQKYPNHKVVSNISDGSGLNSTQLVMKEAGLQF